MLQTLLKVNNAKLEPVYKEANSINPVSRRLADISKAITHFVESAAMR
jgi:UDP-glucose 4-epimerase